MLLGLLAALGAAVLYGVAAVGQASASRRLPPIEDGVLRLARAALTNPLLMTTVVMDLVGAGLHLVAIDRMPLYLAQAGIAAQLPITAADLRAGAARAADAARLGRDPRDLRRGSPCSPPTPVSQRRHRAPARCSCSGCTSGSAWCWRSPASPTAAAAASRVPG